MLLEYFISQRYPSFMKDFTITFGVNLYTNIKKQYIMQQCFGL